MAFEDNRREAVLSDQGHGLAIRLYATPSDVKRGLNRTEVLNRSLMTDP